MKVVIRVSNEDASEDSEVPQKVTSGLQSFYQFLTETNRCSQTFGEYLVEALVTEAAMSEELQRDLQAADESER